MTTLPESIPYAERIERAVDALQGKSGEDHHIVYATRSFWDDDWTKKDVEAAYREAEAQFLIAEQILVGLFKKTSRNVTSNTPGFEWLPVPEAKQWRRGSKTFILYWQHEDKELPCCVEIYAFGSRSSSHRFLSYHEQNAKAARICNEMPLADKIAAIECETTAPDTRSTIFEYCRAFPSKQLADACWRSRARGFGTWKQDQLRQVFEMIYERLETSGDSYPLSPAEYKRVTEGTNDDLIAILDDPSSHPGILSWAANQAIVRSSLDILNAVSRNKHRTFDRNYVGDVKQFLRLAKIEIKKAHAKPS